MGIRRNRTYFLKKWLHQSDRKPLVIRGARQVGKTWLIRDLAEKEGKELIELNFERQPELKTLFSSNHPKETVLNLQTLTGKKIDPSHSILFLDEIQAAPELLAKLRWFAEEMPSMPVIAAGSLLDFALNTHSFSMPVGRISYLYLEPLSFEEFLEAVGKEGMREYLSQYEWGKEIPKAIHQELMRLLKQYIVVGGMPAAVVSWKEKQELEAISQIQFDLLSTYRDDFAKYKGRLDIGRFDDVMRSVPLQLGKKFTYTQANAAIRSEALKQALGLLCQARVCHSVVSTAANGLPLGAEINEKFFKVILLDAGLAAASLGLSFHQIASVEEIEWINKGAVAEQLTGQLLRTIEPFYVCPMLHYWQREKKGAQAEVDYVIAHENQVVPIEVKGGRTGSLKSLLEFMKEKKGKLAVRVNSDLPSRYRVDGAVNYELISVPFYLIEQLHRLIL
jgi:predicted AAA+ superfamily ATPase